MPEMTNAEVAGEKILSLQTLLTDKHPRMPGLLREIHCALKEDPDVVTLLAPEQITMLVNGLKIQTQTEIIANVVKEKKGPKKSIGVDDI